MDPSTAEVTTLAGGPIPGFDDGVGASTRFNSPISVAVGPDGRLYVADFSNNLIRRVDPTTAEVTTLAGGGSFGPGTFADGTGSSARFNGPAGVAVAPDGIVYVADQNNHSIRRIDPVTAEVTTLAGDGTSGFANGTGSAARFDHPTGLAIGPDGTYMSPTKEIIGSGRSILPPARWPQWPATEPQALRTAPPRVPSSTSLWK